MKGLNEDEVNDFVALTETKVWCSVNTPDICMSE